MTNLSKALAKRTVAAVAVGAMAAASLTPALAQDRGPYQDRGPSQGRGDRNGDTISAGDVIAGALIIGGIAAVASAGGRDRGYDRDYDRGYDRGGNRDYDYGRGGYRRGGHDRGGYGYNRGGNPRQAVEQCIRTAENQASGYSYGRADVTDIRSVRERRDGYEVRGRIAVNQMGRDWRRGDDRYGQGWGGDYRGWNENNRGYDSGSFTCRVEYGRVSYLDIDGIRGL
jgi:hypothetical protein